ncbi:hypothetical protein MNBD_GAMMA12-3568 [hydrothermal vent metagenome]|uniref:NodB homology domain-containing protein n=1 Tax=hydrothermal vent metagenome TaxID=652676 RepID=A0A3B0XTH7_9ZZZZ
MLTSRPVSSVASYLFGYGIPVFMLHRIQTDESGSTGITPAYLRQCLEYLVKHKFTFMSLEDALLKLKNRESLPPRPVVFTMDDGFADQVEIGAPVFLEFKCPVTIFLISGMLDGKLWPWDDKIAHMIDMSSMESIDLTLADEEFHIPLSSQSEKTWAKEIIRNEIKAMPMDDTDKVLIYLADAFSTTIPETPPAEFRPMTWEMAREYEKKGIKFAPHTVNHLILSRLNTINAAMEITTSWQRLKNELAAPSPVFCYPTGRYCDYGSREIKILWQQQFIGAVSTLPAQVETSKKPEPYYYNLPRFSLPTSFDEFKQYTSWLGLIRNRSVFYRYF